MRFTFHKIRRSQKQQRAGWTLLELILSLALSVFVIALINSAIQLYYYSLAKVQTSTDQDQLARSLLRRISDDVRATVRYEKFDGSGFMTIPTGASSAASALSGAMSGNSSSGGSSSSNSTSNSSTSSTGTTSTTSKTGTTSSAGTTSGTSSPSNSSTDQSQSQSDSTTDPAAVREIPGIYGTKTTLQIDVCRIPRPDENITADVRSTSYFVNTNSSDKNSNGLIRLERSRASALFASQNGDDGSENGIVLAPEVVYVEFSYFDPVLGDWAEEWDSTVSNNVPKAVKIIMVVDKPKLSSTQDNESLVGMDIAQVKEKYPEAIFQTVISLPSWAVAKPDAESSSADSSTTSSNSTSNTNNSSGSNSSSGSNNSSSSTQSNGRTSGSSANTPSGGKGGSGSNGGKGAGPSPGGGGKGGGGQNGGQDQSKGGKQR